ncbi:MAG: ADOP family duplicated permease [Vicinamibacterales bacterium]
MRTLRSWLLRLMKRGPGTAELDAELQAHLEMHVDAQVRAGALPAEAERQARLRLGGVAATRERTREELSAPAWESLWQDVRHAIRVLRRSPSFAVTAVLAMTVGIGVTVFVFSVVNALVFRSAPIAEPDQVVFVQNDGERQTYPHSYLAYRDVAERNRVFTGTIAYGFNRVPFDFGSGATHAQTSPVTGNYFQVLGVQPAAGRLFHERDDEQQADRVVVLSWDSWQTDFQGRRSVLGTTVRIARELYTVIGVAPKGFHGLEVTMRPRFWIPIQTDGARGRRFREERDSLSVFVVGRVKPGVSREEASANLSAIAADLGREHPRTDAAYRLRITDPGWLGDGFARPIQAFATGVLLLAGLVLFAACANVATALAAHTIDRHREIAIRMSLGAGRSRLVRLVVLEALILAGIGGLLAVGLANAGTEALSGWWLPVDMPSQVDVRPDGRVLGAACVAVLFAVLVAVAGPVHLMLRWQPNQALKTGAGRASGRSGRARGVLVGIQVALCCVLVASAIVAAIALRRAFNVPVGYETQNLVFASLDFSAAGYNEPQRAQMTERALGVVAVLPGAREVAFSSGALPLGGNPPFVKVFPRNGRGVPDRMPMVLTYRVSAGLLETLRVPLLSGRTVAAVDRPGHPNAAVINESFARQVLGTASPIGMTFHLNALTGPVWTVVGVVADGKYESVSEGPRPAAFLPVAQTAYESIRLAARIDGDQDRFLETLQQALVALDPAVPVTVQDSADAMAFVFFPIRIAAIALTALALMAMLLAVNGLYGAFTYVVTSRRREIGVRVALGAGAPRVLHGVLGPTAVVAVAGVCVGLIGALALNRVIGRIVFLARPTDPAVLGLLIVVMAGVVALAGAAPALRALRIAPVIALRAE